MTTVPKVGQVWRHNNTHAEVRVLFLGIVKDVCEHVEPSVIFRHLPRRGRHDNRVISYVQSVFLREFAPAPGWVGIEYRKVEGAWGVYVEDGYWGRVWREKDDMGTSWWFKTSYIQACGGYPNRTAAARALLAIKEPLCL